MPTRMWIRATYEVRARLPRRPMASHAVSGMVAVAVPETDPADHPVVLRLDRTMPPAQEDELRGWNAWTNGGRVPAYQRQSFEFRLDGDGGLLCPVTGPDGMTPMGPADVEATADWMGSHVYWRSRRGECPRPAAMPEASWPAYPGSAPRGDAPPRHDNDAPPWLHRDIGAMGFAEVDEASRRAAVDAFHARVDGLRMIDGVLWRPTAMPSLLLNVDPDIAPLAYVPGHDAFNPLNHRFPHLLQVDLRVGEALGLDAGLAPAAFEFLEDLPHADLAAANLAMLVASASWAFERETVNATPGPALRFLGDLADVRHRLAAGEDAEAVATDTAAALDAAHAALRARGEPDDDRGRGIGNLWAMARWRDGVMAQAAARRREAEAAPGLGGFRP